MDEKDKRLLSLLRRDARMPIVALARELNLSRSATQERLAKLRKSGAIVCFTVVEGTPSKARQSAHFLVVLEPRKRCFQVAPYLRKIPFLTKIDSVAGSVDLFVEIEAETTEDIEAARAAIAATPGIADVNTFIVLERHLGHASLLLPSAPAH